MTILIMEEDQKYFKFMMLKDGTYAFYHCPFGWINSPAYYLRFMYCLISTLPMGTCLSYVNNVLIHSQDETGKEMLKLVDNFLSRVEASGARVQISKTSLVQTKVPYLGYIVGKEGIYMNCKYWLALLDFPVPDSSAALRRFLGMVSYYKTFLPNLSKEAARLHKRKYETGWTSLTKGETEDFYQSKSLWSTLRPLAHQTFLILRFIHLSPAWISAS